MKYDRKLVSLGLAVFAVLVFAVATPAQKYSRIKFKRGTVSKVVAGTLNGYDDKKIFKIRVNAGQTISTEQVAGENDFHVITIYVADPSGTNVNDMDASCNNRTSFSPTVAGDYTLEVFECKKADEWNGAFKFRVTVS